MFPGVLGEGGGGGEAQGHRGLCKTTAHGILLQGVCRLPFNKDWVLRRGLSQSSEDGELSLIEIDTSQ